MEGVGDAAAVVLGGHWRTLVSRVEEEVAWSGKGARSRRKVGTGPWRCGGGARRSIQAPRWDLMNRWNRREASGALGEVGRGGCDWKIGRGGSGGGGTNLVVGR